MNDVITKIDSAASPGLTTSPRVGDYTGILPSQKIHEMLGSGEISMLLVPIDHDQVQRQHRPASGPFCLSRRYEFSSRKGNASAR